MFNIALKMKIKTISVDVDSRTSAPKNALCICNVHTHFKIQGKNTASIDKNNTDIIH